MITLHNKDCLEAMLEMADNQFDLAIVDPPYGIGIAKDFHANGKNNCKGWKKHPYKVWDDTTPTQKYFDELMRVSKNQIIWGGNYFIDKIKKPSQGWVIWNKIQRGFSLADGELAWTSFDKAIRIFDYARGNDKGFAPMVKGSERKFIGIHPTQKPVALYKWLLQNYAKDGDSILDTHLGSGSIAIACHDMGFDLTAYEIDEEYFAAAQQRLKKHQQQLKLF